MPPAPAALNDRATHLALSPYDTVSDPGSCAPGHRPYASVDSQPFSSRDYLRLNVRSFAQPTGNLSKLPRWQSTRRLSLLGALAPSNSQTGRSMCP